MLAFSENTYQQYLIEENLRLKQEVAQWNTAKQRIIQAHNELTGDYYYAPWNIYESHGCTSLAKFARAVEHTFNLP